MLKKSESSRWSKLRVGQKLAVIPLMFIVAISGILAYTVVTARTLRTDAYLVHMAARQRMLNQRQGLEAVLFSQGLSWSAKTLPVNEKEAKLSIIRDSDYRTTRRVTAESLESLIHGGAVLDLFNGETRYLPEAPTAEITRKLQEQKDMFQAYCDKIDRMVTFKPADDDYKSAVMDMMEQNYKLELNCIVVGVLLAENSMSKIGTMIMQEVAIGLMVTVLGLVISIVVTRGILRPLDGVVKLAQQIADGDLRGEKIGNLPSDEVGQLGIVFNVMLDNLKDLAGQTVSVTENLNAAAAEILASTQQQAAGTKEQAATAQQITTTMEEVRQSGGQISERARQVATAAEGTSTASVSGLQSVQEANRTMESIRQQIEEVAENIVALSEKTQAVGEIIATVNDIAERSNLLALNAAIEAADAGEQGNRFSVVASEIKNLADQAKESTVQVRTILGDIQRGINSSVMLAEEAVKRSELGKQRTDVTELTIRQLADTTQDSVQAFQQIIGATNQQQIGFEQVTQGMQDIVQAASQTAASTLQLEKAVVNLNSQSHQLRAAVSRYRI